MSRALVLSLLLCACGAAPAPAAAPTRARPAPHVADREALERETLRCTGSIDSVASFAEIQRRSPDTRRCYEDVLADDPSWRVRVRVDLVVERGGDVSYVSVGDVDRSDFAECLEDALDGLRLPSVVAGECAIVGVPYGFSTAPAP